MVKMPYKYQINDWDYETEEDEDWEDEIYDD